MPFPFPLLTESGTFLENWLVFQAPLPFAGFYQVTTHLGPFWTSHRTGQIPSPFHSNPLNTTTIILTPTFLLQFPNFVGNPSWTESMGQI